MHRRSSECSGRRAYYEDSLGNVPSTATRTPGGDRVTAVQIATEHGILLDFTKYDHCRNGNKGETSIRCEETRTGGRLACGLECGSHQRMRVFMFAAAELCSPGEATHVNEEYSFRLTLHRTLTYCVRESEL